MLILVYIVDILIQSLIRVIVDDTPNRLDDTTIVRIDVQKCILNYAKKKTRKYLSIEKKRK